MTTEDEMNEVIVHPYDEDEQWNESLPEELEAFFVEHGLKGGFRLTLKQYKKLQYTGTATICESWNNEIPTWDTIAMVWGTGAYVFTFSWGGPKNKKSREYKFMIEGERWENIHRDYEEQARDKRLDDIEKRGEEKAIKNKYRYGTGGSTDPFKAMETGMNAIAPLLTALKGDGDGNSKLLEALIGNMKNGDGDLMKMMMVMNQSNQESQRNQTQLMIQMMQSQSTNMLAVFTAMMNKPTNSGEQAMESVMGIMEKTMSMQQLLNPEKPTIADRIFDTIEKFSEPVFQILSTNTDKRGTGDKLLIEKIKKSKEVTALKAQKDQLIDLVNRLDKKYGCSITDKLLKEIEKDRPDETAGNYEIYAEQAEDVETIDEKQETTDAETITKESKSEESPAAAE